jgi:hypothetical protein
MIRPFALAAFAVLALPALAWAKLPDPRFSSVDAVVYGDPDGSREFRVTARDINGAPLNAALITLDFSASPARLYAEQEPGTILDCAKRTLSRYTGRDGLAVFHPRFGGGCTSPSVLVLGDEFFRLREVPARSTDLDGMNACVNVSDLATFASALLYSPDGHPELDFDGSGGRIGLSDLARLADGLLRGTKGSYCP